MRSQEIPDVFLEKAPVTASSQRPRRCYGALVASYRVPTEFLLAILCALTTRLLRFHGAHTVCTVGERTGLVVRALDSGSGDPGSILGRVGVLFP